MIYKDFFYLERFLFLFSKQILITLCLITEKQKDCVRSPESKKKKLIINNNIKIIKISKKDTKYFKDLKCRYQSNNILTISLYFEVYSLGNYLLFDIVTNLSTSSYFLAIFSFFGPL